MKDKLLLLTCLLPLAAAGQKLQASHPSTIYRVVNQKSFLYTASADTASKSNQYLSPGDEAYVVGEFSPRWAIVKRMGGLYLTATQNLSDYNSARLAADRAADAVGMPVDPQTHLYTYQGVVEVAGVSKDELYRRAYEWVAQTYHSANDVIQMQDKAAGQLIAKGLTRVNTHSLGMTVDAGVVYHTLTIYVKDGKYKYVLSNLTHEGGGAPNVHSVGPLERTELPFGASKKFWADVKQDANRNAYRLAAELNEAVALKGRKNPSDF